MSMTRAAFAWLAAGIVLTACSGDDGGDFTTEFSATAALREIPASMSWGVQTEVSMADIDRVSEAVGVERSADLSVSGAPDPWLRVLAGGAPEEGVARRVFVPVAPDLLLHTALYDEHVARSELGWSFEDVDTFVTVRADREWLAVAALRSDTIDLPTVDDDGLIPIGSADEGGRDLEDRTTLRPLGESLRMAADERSVAAVAPSSGPVSAWRSDGETWADDDDFALAAAALDRDADLYAAAFLATTMSIAERDGSSPTPQARLRATGWSGSGESQRTTVAFVFESADRAELAHDGLRDLFESAAPADDDPGSEGFLLDTIERDDRVIVVAGRTLFPPAT